MKVIKAERLIRRECIEVLKEHNATDIESYTLVNNWGYTFKINDKKYDARFVENSYGFSPMRWEVFMPYENFGYDRTLCNQIQEELNTDHHGQEYLETRFNELI